jgi:hypothetical protein
MTPVFLPFKEIAVLLVWLKVGYFIGMTCTAVVLCTIKVARFLPELLSGHTPTSST